MAPSATGVRFLHTSDWQLGMTRHFLQGEAQARYAGARLDAVRALGALARERRCDFVLVAGDVFDSNLPSTSRVRRTVCELSRLESNTSPATSTKSQRRSRARAPSARTASSLAPA